MSSRSNTTTRRDPLVGVDLDDAEQLGVERLRPLRREHADTHEHEALPAGRNDGRRMFVTPTSAIARMFVDLGISTAVGLRRSPRDGDRR